jgi:RHS repeat-associated protein
MVSLTDQRSRWTDNVKGSSTYTGKTRDGVVGQYYYRHRIYAAELGSFLTRDPIGYWAGTNLGEYAGDSPTNRIDPSGLDSDCRDVPDPRKPLPVVVPPPPPDPPDRFGGNPWNPRGNVGPPNFNPVPKVPPAPIWIPIPPSLLPPLPWPLPPFPLPVPIKLPHEM